MLQFAHQKVQLYVDDWTTVTGTDHGTTMLCCRPDSDSVIHVL